MAKKIRKQLRVYLIQALNELAHRHRIDAYAVATLMAHNPKIWKQKAWAHIRKVNAKRLQIAQYKDPAYWRARRLGSLI